MTHQKTFNALFLLSILLSFNIIITRNLRQVHKYKRVFVIVVDSMGIGEMPDAEEYEDKGADTLGHIAENQDKFVIPNLQKNGYSKFKKIKRSISGRKTIGLSNGNERAKYR